MPRVNWETYSLTFDLGQVSGGALGTHVHERTVTVLLRTRVKRNGERVTAYRVLRDSNYNSWSTRHFIEIEWMPSSHMLKREGSRAPNASYAFWGAMKHAMTELDIMPTRAVNLHA